jgi:hypothetical protein
VLTDVFARSGAAVKTRGRPGVSYPFRHVPILTIDQVFYFQVWLIHSAQPMNKGFREGAQMAVHKRGMSLEQFEKTLSVSQRQALGFLRSLAGNNGSTPNNAEQQRPAQVKKVKGPTRDV